jgi:hypothetical protein
MESIKKVIFSERIIIILLMIVILGLLGLVSYYSGREYSENACLATTGNADCK